MAEYREEVRRLHNQINSVFGTEMNSKMKAIIDDAASSKRSPHKGSAKVLGRGPEDSYFNILAVPLNVPRHGDVSGDEEMHSPFHPTVALRVKPKDLTTGTESSWYAIILYF